MNSEKLADFYLKDLSWIKRGWTGTDLESIFIQKAKSHLLILLIFSEVGVDIRAGELQNHSYLSSLHNFFSVVQQYFDLRGQILLSFHDSVPSEISSRVPVLTFARLIDDNNSIVIPDPYYLDNLGYQKNFAIIDKVLMSTSREDRLPIAYWRGSSTGMPELTRESWQDNPRVRLCFKAKETPELIDARITRIVQADEFIESDHRLQSLMAPWDPLQRNIDFRYGIDIDGNACSWGFFQKLYMDLALIKVRSQWMQWYYPLIENGKHVLYVDSDLHGLQDAVSLLRADDSMAMRIADNARELVKGLDYTQAFIYVGLMLQRIFQSYSKS